MSDVIINKALRDNIRELGTLLGNVIKEQEGQNIFNIVEELRVLSKDFRSSYSAETRNKIATVVKKLNYNSAHKVVKAFYIYFLLVNAADEAYQIRARKLTSGNDEASFENMVDEIFKYNLSGSDLMKVFDLLEIIPVFTAHPTEATRQTILRKLQRISYLLLNKQTDDEQIFSEELSRNLQSEITLLWQTDDIRSHKVMVRDEIQHGLFFFKETIYDVIPRFYYLLNQKIGKWYDINQPVDSFIKFGSWMGGDRDGHPFVTVETTKDVVSNNKQTIISLYLKELDQLYTQLSSSVNQIGVSDELKESLKREAHILNQQLSKQIFRNQNELYRAKLIICSIKLNNTLSGSGDRYSDANEFLNDILLISDSLKQNKGSIISENILLPFIYKIKTFGFFLNVLDIRQNSSLINNAVNEIFNKIGLSVNFLALEEEARINLLTSELENPRPLLNERTGISENARTVLEEIKIIKWAQDNIATESCNDYIISNCSNASDVLNALLLAKETGGVTLEESSINYSCVNIIPLFESIYDLRNSTNVMIELFENKVYKSQLAARNNRQIIMLGYSDSNKDGGIVASNYELYKAQIELSALCEKYKVELVFFHGRGGSISRGGGPVFQSILAQPGNSLNGKIKLTEQGEMISAKYLMPDVAERSLEYIASAVLLKTATKKSNLEKEYITKYKALFDGISQDSFEFYKDLVQDQNFIEYFRRATPIDIIERIEIGSRPAARKKDNSISSLRAIPWVFSWTQNRQTISGWYGFGHAISKSVEEGLVSWKELNKIYHEWKFFNSLAQNIEMVLFKTDMKIASEYLILLSNKSQNKIFDKINSEFDRSVNSVLQITGNRNLLDSNKTLQQSLALRNPYMDPISFIQVRFLNEFRKQKAGSRENQQLLQLLRSTVNGIASGIRNTG